jgi:hypothetical protein
VSVHFDFVLSDQDAENLMEIIHLEKCNMLTKAIEAQCSTDRSDRAKVKGLRASARYIDSLKKKMLNKRVV